MNVRLGYPHTWDVGLLNGCESWLYLKVCESQQILPQQALTLLVKKTNKQKNTRLNGPFISSSTMARMYVLPSWDENP